MGTSAQKVDGSYERVRGKEARRQYGHSGSAIQEIKSMPLHLLFPQFKSPQNDVDFNVAIFNFSPLEMNTIWKCDECICEYKFEIFVFRCSFIFLLFGWKKKQKTNRFIILVYLVLFFIFHFFCMYNRIYFFLFFSTKNGWVKRGKNETYKRKQKITDFFLF